MSEPNEYLIVKSLQAVLQTISVGGGYFFDLAGTAVKLDPNQGVEALASPDGLRPFIVIALDPDTWQYHPSKKAEISMPVRLNWFSDTNPVDDDDKMRTYFRGLADLETVLMRASAAATIPQATRIVARGMAAESAASSRLWFYMDLRIVVNRSYGLPMGS